MGHLLGITGNPYLSPVADDDILQAVVLTDTFPTWLRGLTVGKSTRARTPKMGNLAMANV